jgi:hypothetical protein
MGNFKKEFLPQKTQKKQKGGVAWSREQGKKRKSIYPQITQINTD